MHPSSTISSFRPILTQVATTVYWMFVVEEMARSGWKSICQEGSCSKYRIPCLKWIISLASAFLRIYLFSSGGIFRLLRDWSSTWLFDPSQIPSEFDYRYQTHPRLTRFAYLRMLELGRLRCLASVPLEVLPLASSSNYLLSLCCYPINK